MKIQVKFLENKVILSFSLDQKEIGTTNQLDVLRRNICSDKTSDLARSNGCQITIPKEHAHHVVFEIRAKAQASIMQFLKILLKELKEKKENAGPLLSNEECEEINRKIQLEFAKQYAANVPEDDIITILPSQDAKGLGDVIFVKKTMQELIAKAEKTEITPEILKELKDLIDLNDKKQKSPALANRALEKKDEEAQFITVEKLLENIRLHLTAIKKYIRENFFGKVQGVEELYDFLDAAGPKNTSGPIQYTSLEASPFKTLKEQAEYEKRDPEYKNSKYWHGIVKIEHVEKKLIDFQEKELAAAFATSTSLIRLYEKLYDKADDARITEIKEIAALISPVIDYKTVEDFQKTSGAVKRLSRDASIPTLKKKSNPELKKTSQDKRASTLTPVKLPISLHLPNGNHVNHVEPEEKTQAETMQEPLLQKDERDKPQKTTFAQRHPWVVRGAKAGAVVFGILAVVSFFVPVPFLNLTLAAAFTKLSIACGTAAAVATIAAVCILTPAAGGGVGAGGGRLLECTPCCNPTTNAAMHKDLGALSSINGPGARVEVPSDEFAYDFEEKSQQNSKYVPPTPEQTQAAKSTASTVTMRAN